MVIGRALRRLLRGSVVLCAAIKLPLCLLAVIVSGSATAADWKPNRPIEIVVGAGPAGGNDRIARVLQKVIQDTKLIPQTVLVVNKPGAGGAVAQSYVNSHAGDGHYLLVANPSLITNPLTGISTATYLDNTPIVQLLADYVVLVGRSGLPYKTGAEVLKVLHEKPSGLSIAVSPGLGTGTHIAVASLAEAAGIDPTGLRIIPYNGASEALTGVLGQQLDLMPTTSENIQAMVTAGRVQAYGVTAPKRLGGALAAVPTWREQGFDVVFNNWRAVVGPKNLNADQIAYWNDIFSKVVATDEWKAFARNSFLELDYHDSAGLAAMLKSDSDATKAILGRLGLLKTQ